MEQSLGGGWRQAQAPRPPPPTAGRLGVDGCASRQPPEQLPRLPGGEARALRTKDAEASLQRGAAPGEGGRARGGSSGGGGTRGGGTLPDAPAPPRQVADPTRACQVPGTCPARCPRGPGPRWQKGLPGQCRGFGQNETAAPGTRELPAPGAASLASILADQLTEALVSRRAQRPQGRWSRALLRPGDRSLVTLSCSPLDKTSPDPDPPRPDPRHAPPAGLPRPPPPWGEFLRQPCPGSRFANERESPLQSPCASAGDVNAVEPTRMNA